MSEEIIRYDDVMSMDDMDQVTAEMVMREAARHFVISIEEFLIGAELICKVIDIRGRDEALALYEGLNINQHLDTIIAWGRHEVHPMATIKSFAASKVMKHLDWDDQVRLLKNPDQEKIPVIKATMNDSSGEWEFDTIQSSVYDVKPKMVSVVFCESGIRGIEEQKREWISKDRKDKRKVVKFSDISGTLSNLIDFDKDNTRYVVRVKGKRSDTAIQFTERDLLTLINQIRVKRGAEPITRP